jgi:hypothetical protein
VPGVPSISSGRFVAVLPLQVIGVIGRDADPFQLRQRRVAGASTRNIHSKHAVVAT